MGYLLMVNFELAGELVGDKYRLLYATNVHFKYVIDTLSVLLPAMVDGLATSSQAMQQDMDKRIHDITYGPLQPILISKEEFDRLVPIEKLENE